MTGHRVRISKAKVRDWRWQWQCECGRGDTASSWLGACRGTYLHLHLSGVARTQPDPGLVALKTLIGR